MPSCLWEYICIYQNILQQEDCQKLINSAEWQNKVVQQSSVVR
jgi:hypothetical protein